MKTKKSAIAVIVIFLFAVTAIGMNQGQEASPPQAQVALKAEKNTLQVRAAGSGVLFSGNFEGNINGKPIEFEQSGLMSVAMNNGRLSADETRLVEAGLNRITSALKRDKYELPGISFRLKAEGKTLHVETKSGNLVFEGKIEGAINGKPVEFEQKDGETIVINNGALSDGELQMIDAGLSLLKLALGFGRPSK